MNTLVRCPNGHANLLGITLKNVRLQDNAGMNFAVTCQHCGELFDAAPDDGAYSTGPNGHLVKVAETLANASLEELRELRREVEQIRASQNVADAVSVAERLGWTPPGAPAGVPLRQLIKESAAAGNEVLTFVVKLAGVLAFLFVMVNRDSAADVLKLLSTYMR